MADNTNSSSGSNSGLAFILGGVVVALGVLAWVVFGGGFAADEPDLRIELPGGAALEGSVEEGGE
ncbi:hypothetical protein V8J82_16735 [Gymnodinialimonas sp. 2305UL16-5]|uniref:hypothetical protein n=1 Tax=Gymnodinialimonas mytili TaxID=3126503 RepID=UPI0030AECFB8